MVDILHRVGIRAASPQPVYDAIATRDGLAAWWTADTTGTGAVGEVLQFRFPAGGFDMEVVELEAPSRVVWRVVDGPEEWIGTTVRWEIEQDGDYAIVRFVHEGWTEPVEFMHHCSTKWAVFLLSLKSLIETGRGSPSPDDVKIDNWN